MVTIESGPARVLDTGTVTTFAGHPLRIAWTGPQSEAGTAQVGVELAFVTDGAADGPRIDSAVVGDWVVLSCVNFEGGYGRGTAQPVILATGDGETILFHFRALRHGRSADWTVHWTLYAAPE